jgi:small ligand-binding sensory domain FIST
MWHLPIVGGGTSDGVPPAIVDAEGRLYRGPAAGLALRNTGAPLVGMSPACRALPGMWRVSSKRGSMLLALDGEPALDVLSRTASGLEGRPLVMAVVHDDHSPEDEVERAPLRLGRVRPIRGVDPTNRGIVLGDDVREGDLLRFLALDAAAARADLDQLARELSLKASGAATKFGLYVSCTGRGQGLYGASDVDGKILRARFPRLPYAGLMSTFEIAPSRINPSTQFFTGVLGLFTSPS